MWFKMTLEFKLAVNVKIKFSTLLCESYKIKSATCQKNCIPLRTQTLLDKWEFQIKMDGSVNQSVAEITFRVFFGSVVFPQDAWKGFDPNTLSVWL